MKLNVKDTGPELGLNTPLARLSVPGKHTALSDALVPRIYPFAV